jgi:hypothetical protein
MSEKSIRVSGKVFAFFAVGFRGEEDLDRFRGMAATGAMNRNDPELMTGMLRGTGDDDDVGVGLAGPDQVGHVCGGGW